MVTNVARHPETRERVGSGLEYSCDPDEMECDIVPRNGYCTASAAPTLSRNGPLETSLLFH